MGGRGASSGISHKGHVYGTDYKTIFQSGNIKFVEKTSNNSEPLLETMTRGRVYVLLNSKGNPGYIYYYDNNEKKNKEINITHNHKNIGVHVHHGYYHDEYEIAKAKATRLNLKEKAMVERVLNLWYNYKQKR